LLFLASAEQEAATADGDKSRPAAPLRDALSNPPQWIERAVEVAVQSRHCVALELEFEEKNAPAPSKAITVAAPEPVAEAPEPVAEGGDGEVPDPIPLSQMLSVQEQIGRLHREGVQMARQLLPRSHAVRGRAERALDEWLLRTGGDGQPNLSAPTELSSLRSTSRRKVGARSMPPTPARLPASLSSTAGFSAASRKFESIDSDLPCITRMMKKDRLPAAGMSQTWHAASRGSMQTTTASLGSLGSDFDESRCSVAHGISELSFVEHGIAPGGDVYMASLQTKRGDLPQIPKAKAKVRSASQEEGSRKGSKNSQEGEGSPAQGSRRQSKSVVKETAGGLSRARQTKSAQQRAKEAAILLAQKDPFEDWRRNMVNEKEMSYFQRQLRTADGLEVLQHGMKDESKKFKNFYIREISHDDLCELRTDHGPHAVKVSQMSEKKLQAFNSNNCGMTEEGLQRAGTNHNLFNYFGSKTNAEQPSLGTLSKLMKKSHTYGANLDKIAKEEEKRQEAKRAQDRAERLCRISGLGYKRSSRAAGTTSPTSRPSRAA